MVAATQIQQLPKPVLGISSCLLGEKVRYDGGDKYNSYIDLTLGSDFELHGICPETAIGMGVPRKPIHLSGDPASPRVVAVHDPQLDYTRSIIEYGNSAAAKLDQICGYIVKSRSPSCGYRTSPVYRKGQRPVKGSGLFIHTLRHHLPWLPIIDEEQLGDPNRRDNFLTRVFTCARWQALRPELDYKALSSFHQHHKLLLMAHYPVDAKRLGALIANGSSQPLSSLATDYLHGLMRTLAHKATPRRNVNALQHAQGYLKRQLSTHDKREFTEILERYATGQTNLAEPMALLRHHLAQHPHPWLLEQVYLYPGAAEARLRCL